MDCQPGDASSSERMTKGERSERLEKVIKHILETSSLDNEELRIMSDSIPESTDFGNISHSTATENSLSTFSRQLEKKLGDAGADILETGNSEHECAKPYHGVYSDSEISVAVLGTLPSKAVAICLAEVCFARVQCNSFYADENWAKRQIDHIYLTSATLSERNIPMLATIMMIMALGTQFSADTSHESLGPLLYERTISMLPELIRRSDFESVRACLLIATFLFPIDHSGAAYTYLGLALHMAIRNKMHKHAHDEVQVRVWWTLYTFYQRARIIHGYPKTLSYGEVEVRRPRLDPVLEPRNGPSNFLNQVTLIEITITLEKIAYELALLRKERKPAHIANLLVHRRNMLELEDELPHLDIQEDKGRLRLDIHLHLHYWHARLFVGRPFLLEQPSPHEQPLRHPAQTPSSSLSSSTLLRHDAVHAAEKIVQLCQLVHENIGLARASYATEFTSLRAAMLVLIARCITDMAPTISDLLKQGLELIQQMSLGQGQASAETRVVVALQRAIVRLHKRTSSIETHPTTEPLTDQMRQWEMLWQQQSPDFTQYFGDLPNDDTFVHETVLNTDPTRSDRIDVFNQSHEDMWSAIFNAQLDEFSLISAVNGSLDYPGFSELG
ncbi:uncharacterized protein N0V89_009887 [Didymosphaeria variabile]|uniref:Xylanolytic transcriptional activator regulatory domain-containing protein n=1 Tax=Didymosphaeria variabile TaxID=1932322 RepID=A0A9W9C824_9PLEO|nr:uncharacterized protein N0V89_009887 [Didymosphaeria variabile]KAJ4348510.1 hypothetical protein N0V89_009887 [Didymosphaeria variabile]